MKTARTSMGYRQRLGEQIRGGLAKFNRWRAYANSRKRAVTIHNKVIQKRGKSILTQALRVKIKQDSVKRFGTSDYTPWLELYTELRGEFVEGWMPDDHYSLSWIPEMNPREFALISTLKTLDASLFPGFAVPPEGYVIDGRCYNRERLPESCEVLLRKLKGKNGEVVLKEDSAPSGDGIQFIGRSELAEDLIISGGDKVIQPAVIQHEELSRLNRSTVNTIRVTTLLLPGARPKVIHTTLRFGSGSERSVNDSGLFIYLHRDGTAASDAFDDLGLPAGDKHPQTEVPYHSITVPGMDRAIEACMEAHLQYPYVRFIGWDLYIDSESCPWMLEWNARCPDMWVNEALMGPYFKGS